MDTISNYALQFIKHPKKVSEHAHKQTWNPLRRRVQENTLIVISWHISGKPDVDLVMTTFKKAYDKQNTPFSLMFHSDRGSQYTAFAFQQLLNPLNVMQSFSQKGYLFDNACCEFLFKYLKKEEVNRRTYHLLQEFHLSEFEYTEEFYNSKRPHGSLGMMHLTKKKNYTGNRPRQLFSDIVLYKTDPLS